MAHVDTAEAATSSDDAASAATEAYFHDVAALLDGSLAAGERYQASLAAEDTDFVRMNRGKVRQPGHVAQRYLTLRLIRGARHASSTLSLAGSMAVDREGIAGALRDLRDVLPDLADDPHLFLPDAPVSSRVARGAALPDSAQMVDEVLAAAAGTDLVGILASGSVQRGFASSEGQRNWHAARTFNLQWSLYHRGDKAVKSASAGFAWDTAEGAARRADARARLALVAQPSRTLAPGAYRVYLAPAAMEELFGLLSWGGFSGRALATQQSALARMQAGLRLDPRVHVSEDTGRGIAPAFQAEGFARPPRVPLIEAGALAGGLVSPRTAREFGLAANGADAGESPASLHMHGGALATADALAALDTGLAIGNLWYLNYSDRPACRITGMTRFATFRVERGRIVAPVDVMRFDDSLYRMLGENLEALTRDTELMLSGETYRARQLGSMTLPGVLLKSLSFTL
jgi:predicted Zn-dependent protease